MTEDEIEKLRNRSPGEEPFDPYQNVDISDLPEWWQAAIEEFRRHNLRPYRPPRFEDGVLKHEVVDSLEQELGIDIDFICFDVRDDNWKILVNDEAIDTVGHRRSYEGYSVFEVTSDAFESRVRSHFEDETET